jgi:ATP-dependent helicase/nuclease subunit B
MGTVAYIPLGRSFLHDVARGMMTQSRRLNIDLANMILFLPTRRSVREMTDIFLNLTPHQGLILPNMRAVGDMDDQELELVTTAMTGVPVSIPPAVPPFERTVVFARLIRARDPDMPFARALAIAHDLEQFLNEVQNESLTLDGLDGLVALDYAEHWQKTLDFLDILRTAWPAYLTAGGMIDPAHRRNALIQSVIDMWRVAPPTVPVIAAGITGSLPSVAALLAAVSSLPQGQVLLSGFDPDPWRIMADAIDPLHPQYELSRTLNKVGVDPNDLAVWSDSMEEGGQIDSSRVFFNAVMVPGSKSMDWVNLNAIHPPGYFKDVLKHLDIVEVDTHADESRVIALRLRQILNDSKARVLIVTPDRSLALSVIESCRRFGIELNDSAGTPFIQTPVGGYLDFIVQMADTLFAPDTVLSFLDHPLVDPEKINHAARVDLEQRGLRHFALGADVTRHIALLTTRGCTPDAIALYQTLLDQFAPLISGVARSVTEWARAHIAAAEYFVRSPEGTASLWHGEDGGVAQDVFQTLGISLAADQIISFHDYLALYRDLVEQARVNWRGVGHPQVQLLGVFEGRLMRADHVILAGFNEESWPGSLASGPWMSRAMRANFGLPPVEQSVGRMAHDVMQWVVGSRVLITRSRRVDGQDTTPSRWLDRMDTVIAALSGHTVPHRNRQLPILVRQLDEAPGVLPPRIRPMPAPPVALRPKIYSATRLETLICDPYHFYAQKILRLHPVLPFAAPVDARAWGTLVHRVLELFSNAYKDHLPSPGENIWGPFIAQVFLEQSIPLDVQRDIMPKLQKTLDQFLVKDRAWRKKGAYPVATEITFKHGVMINGMSITVSAKLDRVDQWAHSGVAIFDYKTSTQTPTRKSVLARTSPQLPIQTLVATVGTSDTLGPIGKVETVGYWRVTGRPLDFVLWDDAGTSSVSELLSGTNEGVKSVIATFLDPTMPYMPVPNPTEDPGYEDYHVLSRREEWYGVDTANGGVS